MTLLSSRSINNGQALFLLTIWCQTGDTPFLTKVYLVLWSIMDRIVMTYAHAWESNTTFKSLPKYHLLHPIATEILMDFQHMDLWMCCGRVCDIWKRQMWVFITNLLTFIDSTLGFLVSGKGELDHDLSLIPRDFSPCGLKCENVLHWINPLPPFGARDTPPVNHGNRYARWARLSTNQRTTADRWRPPWDRDKTIRDSQIQITWWT